MTAHTYGWADVDQMNRKHYGRGKPQELLNAEFNRNMAADELETATERYYNAKSFYCETEEDLLRMRNAEGAYDQAEQVCQALYIKYGYQEA